MTTCRACLIRCPGGCGRQCHIEMPSQQSSQTDFGSLDQIMMQMIFFASYIIDKQSPVESQAKTLAEFYARFLSMRVSHETDHITKQATGCPFCMSLKLALVLNRATSQ